MLFLFILFVTFSECCAQLDFIKKYHLNGRESYAQAIDNYDDNFIIAGTVNRRGF